MSIDETSMFFLVLRIVLGVIFIYHGISKVGSTKSLNKWNAWKKEFGKSKIQAKNDYISYVDFIIHTNL